MHAKEERIFLELGQLIAEVWKDKWVGIEAIRWMYMEEGRQLYRGENYPLICSHQPSDSFMLLCLSRAFRIKSRSRDISIQD